MRGPSWPRSALEQFPIGPGSVQGGVRGSEVGPLSLNRLLRLYHCPPLLPSHLCHDNFGLQCLPWYLCKWWLRQLKIKVAG